MECINTSQIHIILTHITLKLSLKAIYRCIVILESTFNVNTQNKTPVK